MTLRTNGETTCLNKINKVIGLKMISNGNFGYKGRSYIDFGLISVNTKVETSVNLSRLDIGSLQRS